MFVGCNICKLRSLYIVFLCFSQREKFTLVSSTLESSVLENAPVNIGDTVYTEINWLAFIELCGFFSFHIYFLFSFLRTSNP